ncbi:competence protein ComG [Bacillus clarus]|uniref:Competence protein ComG n=1 Tax=Bacillus clarus TaxID=2338372 RepID=A0A090YN17_9BACI|nr:competence type IV pilus minor pilin ComGF [Bacillus clarus]KFM99596.1 putative comG operon protein 6 [Bacillus clarus]RFT67275.1 competence protein ComG [Bacillus clarus]
MQTSKKKEAGFTLLEMMVCFFFLSIFFLLVPRLHSLFIEKAYSEELSNWEWNVFMNQVQLEFREVRLGKIILLENKGSVMRFQLSNGNVVTYENVNNNLVRKVNGRGREIVLQKISVISYELTPYMLSIHVQEIGGKIYNGVATRYDAIEMMI